MNMRPVIIQKAGIAGIALVAGFLGSLVHDWVRDVTSTRGVNEVLRAQRYEIVSRSGRVLSYWGPDDDPNIPASTPRGTLLVFMNEKWTKGGVFGSESGNNGPTLRFYDRNQSERVSLELRQGGDPLLAFNSTNRAGAVLLGAIDQSDLWTDKRGDSWGLRLRSGNAQSIVFASEWTGGMPQSGVIVVGLQGTMGAAARSQGTIRPLCPVMRVHPRPISYASRPICVRR